MITPKQLHEASLEASRARRELERLKQTYLELYRLAKSAGVKLPREMHYAAGRCKCDANAQAIPRL